LEIPPQELISARKNIHLLQGFVNAKPELDAISRKERIQITT
jgi:hypothetical protein